MTEQELYNWVSANFGKISQRDMRSLLKGKVQMKDLQAVRNRIRAERKAGIPTDADILAYVSKNWEVMSDIQMAQVLGVPKYRVKEVRVAARLLYSELRTGNHICWRCAKSTNLYRCKYVASCLGMEDHRKYIEGSEIKNGKIVYCPEFEGDRL